MKAKILSSLLLTTMLATPAAMASQSEDELVTWGDEVAYGKLSDAYNGHNWPKGEGFKNWHEATRGAMFARAETRHAQASMVQNYFLPVFRGDDSSQRHLANQVCDWFDARAKAGLSAAELFASYNEEGPVKLGGAYQMRDAPIRPGDKGFYAKSQRQIAHLRGIIVIQRDKIAHRPAEKEELQTTKSSLETRIDELKKSMSLLDEIIADANAEIVRFTPELESQRQALAKTEEMRRKAQALLAAIEENETRALAGLKECHASVVAKLCSAQEEIGKLTAELNAAPVFEESTGDYASYVPTSEDEKLDEQQKVTEPGAEAMANNNNSNNVVEEASEPAKEDLQESEVIKTNVVEEVTPAVVKDDSSEVLKKQIEQKEIESAIYRTDLVQLGTQIEKEEKRVNAIRQAAQEKLAAEDAKDDRLHTLIDEMAQTICAAEHKRTATLETKRKQAEEVSQLMADQVKNATALEQFDQETRALEETLKDLEKTRANAIMASDLHALVKFVAMMNMLSAFPNDKWIDADTAAPEVIPGAFLGHVKRIAENFAKDRLIHIGSDIEGDAVSSFVSKVSKLDVIGATNNIVGNFASRRNFDNAYGLSAASYIVKELRICIENINETTAETLSADNLIKQFSRTLDGLQLPTKIAAKAQLDRERFDQLLEQALPNHRVEHILEQGVLKWQARITPDKEAMAAQMCFAHTFLSGGYQLDNIRYLLSLEAVVQSFDPPFKPYELDAKSGYWGLAAHQLNQAYVMDWHNPNSEAHRRITPVYNFLLKKAAKQAAKAKAGVTMQVVSSDDKGKEDARMQDAKAKTAGEKLLKVISYLSLYGTVHIDYTGNDAKVLPLVDPNLLPLLKEEPTLQQRLDYILVNKAIKWATKLWKEDRPFIEAKALESWMFYGFEKLFEDKEQAK
ncbi:MAG: hypothetical protein KBB83_08080 [Alphaproteobacteria bacterium]|nr:hypothetical protein [Alphaproteobacteria bacterium]